MWCMWLLGMENKWGYEEGGRGFHCLPLIGQAWRHSPPRLPPPSILLSALITPPSICVHLPLLLNSRYPHHNRSLRYSLAFWTRRRRLCFGGGFLVFGFFLFIFTSHGCLLGASSLPQFLFSLFFTSYFSTSACPSSVLAGYVFFQHATSVHHPDLCNGAAHASY